MNVKQFIESYKGISNYIIIDYYTEKVLYSVSNENIKFVNIVLRKYGNYEIVFWSNRLNELLIYIG